mgnify:FL=1
MRRWDEVEAFVEVVRRGGFSAAAERLGVSVSHVSRSVSELERRLGLPLLHRTTRSVRLTEAGRAYYERCSRALDEFHAAEALLVQEQHEPRGTLRITCATTFGERFIAPLLNELLLRHPHLGLELTLTNEQVDVVGEGYDLAVRMGNLKAPSSLLARRLCDRREYVCASPEYLGRRGVPRTLEDLKQHDCLLGTHPIWTFSEGGKVREVRPEGRWRANSGAALLDAVRKGLGVARLPDYYVEEAIARGELVSLLERYRHPFTGVWLVYPAGRQRSHKLQLVCDFLVERFSDQPPWREHVPSR